MKFENDSVRGTLSVVPGSGTGDLRGLRGEGDLVWSHGSITLEYDVE